MGSYYDLSSYDVEDELELRSQPPVTNMCAAVAYIGNLLGSHKLKYAIMGGFAMVCRGSSRTTLDVDIATTASMKQLWQAVEPQPGKVLPRLVIPNTKLLDKIIRIFVETGPSHGDEYCEDDHLIEVDLNVFGARSGPSDLEQHIELLQVDLGGQIFQFPVLDVYYMMRTKLRTLTSRAAGRDFDDVDFLLMHYNKEVIQISNLLDLNDRASFICTDLIQSRGPAAERQYRKLLHL